MTTEKKDHSENFRKAGPIDLDTCEPWSAAEAGTHLKECEEKADEPIIISNKRPSKSQPFASTLKLLIKNTTSKRLSLTKRHGGSRSTTSSSSIEGGTSMSSGPSTDDHDDDGENEPPTFQYKEHVKSPLLKNTDTSLYDNRLIAIEQGNATSRRVAKPFRQYQSMDGIIAL